MYAFVLERDVGVDIEIIRDNVEHDRIAENFFCHLEVRAASTRLGIEVEVLYNVGTANSKPPDAFPSPLPVRESTDHDRVWLAR